MTPRVNKWLDLVDRAGWTGLQAAAGAGLAAVVLDLDWTELALVVGGAFAGAVAKVIVGQNTGTDDTGALIGTSPIAPAPKDSP